MADTNRRSYSADGARRSYSDDFKAAIVKEFRDARTQLDSNWKAGKAVGKKYQLNGNMIERWVKEADEQAKAGTPKVRAKPTNFKYPADFKAGVIAEIAATLPVEGVRTWSLLAAKYGVHNTTLRDWWRMGQGAPGKDPETGKRTRGVRDAPAAPASLPVAAPPPQPPAEHREFRQDDVGHRPEVQWQMSARPHPDYLAHKVSELEHQVRVLTAEKQALMVALGLVNTHKVEVSPPPGTI